MVGAGHWSLCSGNRFAQAPRVGPFVILITYLATASGQWPVLRTTPKTRKTRILGTKTRSTCCGGIASVEVLEEMSADQSVHDQQRLRHLPGEYVPTSTDTHSDISTLWLFQISEFLSIYFPIHYYLNQKISYKSWNLIRVKIISWNWNYRKPSSTYYKDRIFATLF